jgi:mono/diheme cytochrome c family protein
MGNTARRHSHLAGALLAFGGMLGLLTLTACGGGEAKGGGGEAASGDSTAAAPASPGTAMASAASDSAAAPTGAPNGAEIYKRCATCHQATGKGMPGAFPPLAGSPITNAKDPAAAIRIVLHGLTGLVTVNGQRFNSTMPPYGTNQPLDDSSVAAVLTYERSSWGNTGSAVTPEQVAAQRAATASRKTPWTAEELEPLLRAGAH